jgi:hypothetical protein
MIISGIFTAGGIKLRKVTGSREASGPRKGIPEVREIKYITTIAELRKIPIL